MNKLHDWQLTIVEMRWAIFALGMVLRITFRNEGFLGYTAGILLGLALGLILMRPYTE
jgi:hypothetical protein